MPAKRDQSEELEDLAQAGDPEELEDFDEEELEETLPPPPDDDVSGATSLDELLAQHAARKGSDEVDDDDDEIMALQSERDQRFWGSATARVIPIKDRQEFVCNRCHLVKAKSQLADAQRGLCRDCV
jgi:Domain of unknown function (DUF4193)